jgi:DUF971 family protein
MSDDLRLSPVELRAPRGAKSLEITWADGVTHTYRHALLRGFCPCAYCQGHQGPIGWTAAATDDDLDVLEIEEVGNYAIRLIFADGHSTGIYSFSHLRQLGEVASLPLDEAKKLHFSR